MNIVFHNRKGSLADHFKGIASEKLESLKRFAVSIDRVEVEIIHEQNPRQGKHSHKVILTSHGSGPLIRSEASEFNDVAAFDQAVKSFELQLRKVHERSNEHNRDSIKNFSE